MNDSNLRFETDNDNSNAYHATTNLNTAIENPQVSINSAIGVNIQDLDNSNSFTNDYAGNQGFNNDVQLNQNSDFINNQFINNNQNFSGSQKLYSPGSDNEINVGGQSTVQDNNTDSQYMFINNGNNLGSVSDVNATLNNEQSIESSSINNNVTYEPTLKQKKKPRGLMVSKELKVMIFIVAILLLFIFVVPYIYDFFKELELVITSG